MATSTSTHPPVNAWFKASSLTVIGYSTLTVGLLVLLATNGASGIPAAISVGVPALIGVGLLQAAAGMLQLRRGVSRAQRKARHGLALQSVGLIGLLFGALTLAASSEFLIWSISAIFVVGSCVLMIGGGMRLRSHFADIGASNRKGVDFLVLGTAAIFAGVAVILGSQVAYYFWLSDLGTIVATDVGVGVTACGCVTAGFSFSLLAQPS